MWCFVRNMLSQSPNPIGIDLGTDALRLAQVRWVDGDYRMVAAASAPIPEEIRHNDAARLAFFTQAVPRLLSGGGFHGRQAVLSLPASIVHVQHLRLNRVEEPALAQAIAEEMRDKLPMDPSQALMRHSTPDLTLNVYARSRSGRLSELAAAAGRGVLLTVRTAGLMVML